jgi:hypothetical protein
LVYRDGMGYDVYSNYPLGFDYTPVTTIKEAQNCRNGYLLLDEIWKWVHARTSMSKINKEMMSICLLNRKRKMNIIYNTQLRRTIDIILKEITTFRYLPNIVLHDDNKRYIHYIVKDLLDRESEEMVIPVPLSEIGKNFNTNYEIEDLITPLEKGIYDEKEFVKAVKKVKGVKYVDLLPNSGNGSSWACDVLVYADNGLYGFDIKGSNKNYVYLQDFGDELIKKIKNIQDHNAIPFIAYPEWKKENLCYPNHWYIYRLDENTYLRRLKTMPFYPKLVSKSVILKNMNFNRE